MAVERSLINLRGGLLGLIRQRLWLQVLVGMALGIGLGVLIGPTVGLVSPYAAVLIGNWVALPGKLFLLAIQFVVVPLVVASVIRGIAAGEGSDGLGRLGGWTVAFFLVTTVVAVGLGLAVALVLSPGSFIEGAVLRGALAEGAAGQAAAVAAPVDGPPKPEEIPELIASLFPRDPLTTFISGNMLQIVLTSVIIGIALVTLSPDQRKPLLDLLASVQAACMAIVGWVLRFAPFAVFGLLAHITARVGLSALLGVSAYVATVMLGLALLFAVYLAIVTFVARRSPLHFMAAAREALLLAFSTSSSAAVMPLSLSTAEQKLKVRESVARFVVPLGTTINMGGTALYQGVAALFLAQVFDVQIGVAGMLLIVVMATGAAIGSPGTPGVGIVILATILNSVGIPPAGIAIILGVDRLLDMCRTVVNVTGDLVACVTIDHLLKGPKARAEEHLGRAPTPAMPGAANPGDSARADYAGPAHDPALATDQRPRKRTNPT
ncbi:MAG: dicarboxylate/amino acid:cation symporter [Rhodospirillales bacterium]|nr:dicarboxylate/amino acid:cation symporter [Rhodospirillales bacterium]